MPGNPTGAVPSVGGSSSSPAPPTAAEDMSVVQKCEQLEACLVEMHAGMEQIEAPQEGQDASAVASTPGAHGSLNRLSESTQRLLGRLQALHTSIGQI